MLSASGTVSDLANPLHEDLNVVSRSGGHPARWPSLNNNQLSVNLGLRSPSASRMLASTVLLNLQ